MRKLFLNSAPLGITLALFTGLSAACGGFQIEEGSGVSATSVRGVSPFTSIQVSSGMNVDLVAGDYAAIVVTADDNFLELIRTEVVDDVLIIEPAEDGLLLSPQTPMTIEVTTPHLAGVQASGGSEVHGTVACGGDQSTLRLSASGGSQFELSDVDVAALSLEMSGGSQATLSGQATIADIKLSGGSVADLGALDVTAADADMSGGSQASMSVSQHVSGSLSGGAQLDLIGSPIIDVSTSGGSQVSSADAS